MAPHADTTDDLTALPGGTATVGSVQVEGSTTVVRLDYPFGAQVVRMPVLPHLEPATCEHTIRKAISVQVRNADGLECSVLATSDDGPQRVPITLPQALALAENGVHTVFQTG